MPGSVNNLNFHHYTSILKTKVYKKPRRTIKGLFLHLFFTLLPEKEKNATAPISAFYAVFPYQSRIQISGLVRCGISQTRFRQMNCVDLCELTR
jgi:hypothetical protein